MAFFESERSQCEYYKRRDDITAARQRLPFKKFLTDSARSEFHGMTQDEVYNFLKHPANEKSAGDNDEEAYGLFGFLMSFEADCI